jgi:hypothetical protein
MNKKLMFIENHLPNLGQPNKKEGAKFPRQKPSIFAPCGRQSGGLLSSSAI